MSKVMGMRNNIPVAKPGASYLSHKVSVDEAINRVVTSGWYIDGEQCRAFELEFARWLGLAQVVGVGNGTDALEISLRALKISHGDEVITVSHTAVATVVAIELVGATPVLIDIDPTTYTMDPQLIESAVTSRTKAIIPVHLYGMPVDMMPLIETARRYNLSIIEDCAQAHGAKYRGKIVGTLGNIAGFSFYPTKNLGAFGDGGAVASNDQTLMAMVRSIAQYGWRERYISEQVGINTRLDELQAAILRVKLIDLDHANARRNAIARRYTAALSAKVVTPTVPSDRQSVFHLYVIRHPERKKLQEYLAKRDIGTAIHYPVPIHLQPAYYGRFGKKGSLPETERAAQEILSLPIYPELTDDEVETIIEAICAFN